MQTHTHTDSNVIIEAYYFIITFKARSLCVGEKKRWLSACRISFMSHMFGLDALLRYLLSFKSKQGHQFVVVLCSVR